MLCIVATAYSNHWLQESAIYKSQNHKNQCKCYLTHCNIFTYENYSTMHNNQYARLQKTKERTLSADSENKITKISQRAKRCSNASMTNSRILQVFQKF